LSIPIYVINLPRDEQRRDYMRRALADLGLTAEFVPGVEGKLLTPQELESYDSPRARAYYGSDMRRGEIGCYLGHYRLYQRLLREKAELALVLEDDVTLDASLPDLLRAVASPDGQAALAGSGWSIIHQRSGRAKVHSGEGKRFRGHTLARFASGHELHLLRTHILSGGAYLINRNGLERMVKYGRRIFMPIDHTMDRYWENGILPMVLRPLPVGHNNSLESSIGAHGQDAREDYPWTDRLAHRWRRAYDSLPKRWFWAWRWLRGKPV
jgi:glycosyl transferase, family 25